MFISCSKWHDVFHKQSRFRDAVQCFSGEANPIRCMMEGQKSQRQRREGNSSNGWFRFKPTKGSSWGILVKWDLKFIKTEMQYAFYLGVLLIDFIVFDSSGAPLILHSLHMFGYCQKLPFDCTGKGKHDANEMKRLLMPHMLDDDDITIEVMVIHYKKDGTNQRR